MRKSRFTEPRIMAVLRQAESGVTVPEHCREHGIITASFCKCRSKYGGMDVEPRERHRYRRHHTRPETADDCLKSSSATR